MGPKETTNRKDFQFRKAGVLDLPFIFNLIIDGSIDGSFTECLLTSSGTIFLFMYLLLRLLPLPFVIRKYNKIKIFKNEQNDLGFLDSSEEKKLNSQKIELCAIKHVFRNNGVGTLMIQLYLESLPKNIEVQAYCTKYAKTMQHILKKLGFRRSKAVTRHTLEQYVFKRKK